MTIAFDLGKTLSTHPTLRAVARGLLSIGCSVHVISAIYRKDEIEARKLISSWHIPFTGIHFVYQDGQPSTAEHIGGAKAAVMRSIGAQVLFDDNPKVVDEIRSLGLHAEVIPR